MIKYKLKEAFGGKPAGATLVIIKNEEIDNKDASRSWEYKGANITIPLNSPLIARFKIEWEILSFRTYRSLFVGSFAETTLRSNGLYLNDKDQSKEGVYPLEKVIEEQSASLKWNPYKVKRLSDGEIYTVGDYIEKDGVIAQISRIDYNEAREDILLLTNPSQVDSWISDASKIIDVRASIEKRLKQKMVLHLTPSDYLYPHDHMHINDYSKHDNLKAHLKIAFAEADMVIFTRGNIDAVIYKYTTHSENG